MRIYNIRVLLFCLLLTSCEYSNKNVNTYVETMLPIDSLSENVLMSYIGLPLDNLPDIEGFEKRRNVITGDEGESWSSIDYYFNNQLIFTVESNWEQKDKAYRITLFSNIVIDTDIYVGQFLANVIEKIDQNILSNPDGFLFVNINDKPNVYLQLNIENVDKNSPLLYGVDKLKDVPDSLEIESIVIR